MAFNWLRSRFRSVSCDYDGKQSCKCLANGSEFSLKSSALKLCKRTGGVADQQLSLFCSVPHRNSSRVGGKRLFELAVRDVFELH